MKGPYVTWPPVSEKPWHEPAIKRKSCTKCGIYQDSPKSFHWTGCTFIDDNQTRSVCASGQAERVRL